MYVLFMQFSQLITRHRIIRRDIVPWNPEQYHIFRNERSAPFDNLFNLIKVRQGLTVMDLGCGTGELTRRLADRILNPL